MALTLIACAAAIIVTVVSIAAGAYVARLERKEGIYRLANKYPADTIPWAVARARCHMMIVGGVPYYFVMVLGYTQSHLVLYPRSIFGVVLSTSRKEPPKVAIPFQNIMIESRAWWGGTKFLITDNEGSHYNLWVDIPMTDYKQLSRRIRKR